MSFGFLRHLTHQKWNEIYEDIEKKHPIKESAMYTYPVPAYVFDLECEYCKAKWHSEEFSSEGADREQNRIQAQYKQHLKDFHPEKSS